MYLFVDIPPLEQSSVHSEKDERSHPYHYAHLTEYRFDISIDIDSTISAVDADAVVYVICV